MNEEGSDRPAVRDRLLRPDAGPPAAHRRRAREADATKRARRWHHAKWIAINLVLIAFTGWLYAKFLIPRYVVGDTSATRVAPDVWIADKYDEPSAVQRETPLKQGSPTATSTRVDKTFGQERIRARRKQQQSRSAAARTDMPEPAPGARKNAIDAARKRGDFRCIDGRGYIIERTATGTTVQDTETGCRVPGFNG